MSSHGGKRKGAGGKKGLSVRPKITDYFTYEDVKEFIKDVKARYKNDTNLMKWLGDHLLGKAVQPIGNEPDKDFKISLSWEDEDTDSVQPSQVPKGNTPLEKAIQSSGMGSKMRKDNPSDQRADKGILPR